MKSSKNYHYHFFQHALFLEFQNPLRFSFPNHYNQCLQLHQFHQLISTDLLTEAQNHLFLTLVIKRNFEKSIIVFGIVNIKKVFAVRYPEIIYLLNSLLRSFIIWLHFSNLIFFCCEVGCTFAVFVFFFKFICCLSLPFILSSN